MIMNNMVIYNFQVMFNTFSELLLPETRPNPYLFNDVSKPKPYPGDPFDLGRTPDTGKVKCFCCK